MPNDVIPQVPFHWAYYSGILEALGEQLWGCHEVIDAPASALDVIGYDRPTHLRARRVRMVGLVVPELQNPIFPAFAEVVAGALAVRGASEFDPNAVTCASASVFLRRFAGARASSVIHAYGKALK